MALVERDPEQEILGIALGVVDATLSAAKAAKPDDPVVTSMVELVSPEQVESPQPVRAADVLIVAEQLNAAIGQPPTVIGGFA